MTAPVDALAVMEEARALAADQRDMHDDNDNTPMAGSWESFRAEVVAARAAIAELIEAAKESTAFIGYESPGTEAIRARVYAALARVGGAT